MKILRIRPSKQIRGAGKRKLRTWYKIVLGYKPEGFKGSPYAIIAANKLPAVFNALTKEWDSVLSRDYL